MSPMTSATMHPTKRHPRRANGVHCPFPLHLHASVCVFCCYTTRRVETTKGAPDLFLVVTYIAPIPLHRLPCSGFTTRTTTFASLKVASQFHHHQKCSSLRMWSNGYYLLLLLMTVVSFLLCSGGHELILKLLSITTPAMVH